jgi:hypothetical protein
MLPEQVKVLGVARPRRGDVERRLPPAIRPESPSDRFVISCRIAVPGARVPTAVRTLENEFAQARPSALVD